MTKKSKHASVREIFDPFSEIVPVQMVLGSKPPKTKLHTFGCAFRS